jgi:peptide/nickel transport system ATP-binding protein
MGMIMITHDMGVIAEIADDIAVMYGGQIVEAAPAVSLFDHPEHPYTEALLGALPQLEGANARTSRLLAIPGQPPDLVDPPQGCRFAPRCRYASPADTCASQPQQLRELGRGHFVRSAHPTSERLTKAKVVRA